MRSQITLGASIGALAIALGLALFSSAAAQQATGKTEVTVYTFGGGKTDAEYGTVTSAKIQGTSAGGTLVLTALKDGNTFEVTIKFQDQASALAAVQLIHSRGGATMGCGGSPTPNATNPKLKTLTTDNLVLTPR